MFQIKNLKSFINTKTLSIFALTLVLGLTFNSIFGRYIFRYSITETFTLNEAKAKVGKRVRSDFSGKSIMGTVISHDKDVNDEGVYVSIVFDTPIIDTPNTGKVFQLKCGKEVYQQTVTEIDEDK